MTKKYMPTKVFTFRFIKFTLFDLTLAHRVRKHLYFINVLQLITRAIRFMMQTQITAVDGTHDALKVLTIVDK